MKLLLVKHSNSNHNPHQPSRDWALTDAGVQRCQPLAQHLAHYQPKRLFASTMLKAQQTANYISQALDNIPIIENSLLEEHSRQTNAPYGTLEIFHARVKQMFSQPDDLIYGDETANQARLRFDQGIQECLVEAQSEEAVVVIAHGTVNVLFTEQYNDIDSYDLWFRLKLPSILVLDLPTFKLETVIEDAGIPPHS